MFASQFIGKFKLIVKTKKKRCVSNEKINARKRFYDLSLTRYCLFVTNFLLSKLLRVFFVFVCAICSLICCFCWWRKLLNDCLACRLAKSTSNWSTGKTQTWAKISLTTQTKHFRLQLRGSSILEVTKRISNRSVWAAAVFFNVAQEEKRRKFWVNCVKVKDEGVACVSWINFLVFCCCCRAAADRVLEKKLKKESSRALLFFPFVGGWLKAPAGVGQLRRRTLLVKQLNLLHNALTGCQFAKASKSKICCIFKFGKCDR